MSSNPPPLPAWLTQAATVMAGVLLGFNVVFDALNAGYQGGEVTFGLLGLFGGLLGLHKSLRGSSGGDDK